MDVSSFGIDHDRLLRGVYVSRLDEVGGGFVTTFDIRMKEPNRCPVIDNPAMHTLEHLIAMYYRSSPEWDSRTVYIGPMGCRTGMYFLFKGDLQPGDVLDGVRAAFAHVAAFQGEIPAAKPKMCGNYLDHNLEMARYEAREFLELLNDLKPENTEYPKTDY
ncbi:MAG: S-ribosylhomocysteine lyase [Clostridiales bacterium]|jgi:S-ribosylhomocysteine lyase|nr:S-ribosylhomocysteine lyase [Clostridiales bacterium]